PGRGDTATARANRAARTRRWAGGCGRRLALLGKHDLKQARSVARIDGNQPAVIAAAVHPAGEANVVLHVLGAHEAGPGVAVAVGARRLHATTCLSASTASARSGTSRWSPDCMSLTDIPSLPTITTARAPSRSACLSWPLSERPACSICALKPAPRSAPRTTNALVDSPSRTT